MTWRTTLFLPVISTLLAVWATSAAYAQDPAPPKPKPGTDVSVCAKISASARYEGYGYTHLVELRNTCEKPVICTVWTDVDPEKLTLEAAPGKSASIATRKGSPAREVVAQSECRFK